MNLPNMALIKPSMTVRPFEHRYQVEDQSKNRPRNFGSKNSGILSKLKNYFENPINPFISKLIHVRWKLWIFGLFIYCFIMFCVLEERDELLTEEDHSSLREWVNENEDILRTEYKERSELAHEICNQYDVYVPPNEYSKLPGSQQLLDYSDWLSLKRINWNYMYYVPSQDLVYCKVPKSGSSTWVYNLLKLARAPEELISSDIGLHKILRDYYPQMSNTKMKRVFKRSFKFLVVRHPFDRILSAFRDKMEDYQRDLRFREGFYYTMYGKNIVKIYRDQNDITIANRTEPTWKEFVKYLINTPAATFDEHWKPIYMLCSPCVLKYNVIAKMNTFSEDTQFIINQLGLEERLHVEWIHRTSSSKTSQLVQDYFSQLTKKQVDQLFAKYHLDFELFGYDYEEYRALATGV